MLLRQRVLDHRKQQATLPRLRLRRTLWANTGGIWPLLLVIFLAQCVVGMGFNVITELLPGKVPHALQGVLVAAAILLMLAIVFGMMLRLAEPMPTAVIEHELAEGRCPSCGYDLTRIAPEPDRCSVCPECGAAWRLPPSSLPNPAESP